MAYEYVQNKSLQINNQTEAAGWSNGKASANYMSEVAGTSGPGHTFSFTEWVTIS